MFFKSETIQKRYEEKVDAIVRYFKEEYNTKALNALQITEIVRNFKQEIIKRR